MSNMTKEYYNKLDAAAKTLCKYCENDECEKCHVSVLMNDAYAEFCETNDEEGEDE